MWRKGQPPAEWNRVEIVMRVQRGELSVSDAARILGLSRTHFYRLEKEVVAAARQAGRPAKRGPRRPAADPRLRDLEERLKVANRDRELLKLKIGRLEEIQREIVDRGLAVEREKKGAVGGARKKVQAGVQAADAVARRGKAAPGKQRPGAVRADGPRPGEFLPLEARSAEGTRKAGTEGARPGGPGGDAGGDPGEAAAEEKHLGRRDPLRGV